MDNVSEAEGYEDTSDEGEEPIEDQLDDQTDYKDYDFPCGY
jgi:hypothetical protein